MLWRWYRSAMDDSTQISLQCQLPQEMREAHAKSVRSQPETLGRGSLFRQTRCVYNNRLFPEYICWWMYELGVCTPSYTLNVCVCVSVSMVSKLRIRTNNSLSSTTPIIGHHPSSSPPPSNLFVQIPRAIRHAVMVSQGNAIQSQDAPAHAVMLLDATCESWICIAGSSQYGSDIWTVHSSKFQSTNVTDPEYPVTFYDVDMLYPLSRQLMTKEILVMGDFNWRWLGSSNKSPPTSVKSESSSTSKKATKISQSTSRGSEETTSGGSTSSADEEESTDSDSEGRTGKRPGTAVVGSSGSGNATSSGSLSSVPARCEPPIKTKPKFRKYGYDDFQLVKVLGKGSFGKV